MSIDKNGTICALYASPEHSRYTFGRLRVTLPKEYRAQSFLKDIKNENIKQEMILQIHRYKITNLNIFTIHKKD